MGFFDVFKAIGIPALIAAVLYSLLAFLLLPLLRAHRARYSQYLPIDNLSQRTAHLRSRAGDALTNFILPSSVRWRRESVSGGFGSLEDEGAFADEEGERMVGFDFGARRGREVVVGGAGVGSERRLSRDLEEGFRDESDEEEEEERGQGRR